MNVATIGLLTYGMNAVWLVLALIVLIVLVRLYVQTRMSGFLWLLFAVVVWPFLSRGVSMALPVYIAQQAMTTDRMMMFSIGVAAIETILGAVFLLISVLVLQREITAQLLVGRTVVPGTRSVSGLPPYGV